MTKYTALILIIALRIFFHPLHDKTIASPFTSPSPVVSSAEMIVPATIIHIQGTTTNNKVQLVWNIDSNETADMFEVERSTDGVRFSVAALVFAGESTHSLQYKYYEKYRNGNSYYRIRLINKNKSVVCSAIIRMDTTA